MSKKKSYDHHHTPIIETQLFDLGPFLILDISAGLKNMNADALLFQDILKAMLEKELPQEKQAFHEAHLQQDWETIGKMVHKMKGGAMYTGLLRLQYACEYFEMGYSRHQKPFIEKLYRQIIETIEITRIELQYWLESNQNSSE